MKQLTVRLMSVCLFPLICLPVSAGFVSYTNSADWATAVGGAFDTEDFNSVSVPDLQPSSGPIDLNGSTLTVLGTDNSVGGPNITGGVFEGSLFPTSDGHTAYQFDFDAPIIGFGADFFGAASGLGLVITTTDGSVDIFDFYDGFDDGFLGFTTMSAISSISLVGSDANGGGAIGEIFDMDNMVFSFAATTVPEPATLLLMGIGLGGLALRRRLLN